MAKRKYSKNAPNITKILIGVICALVVILAVVIVVAVLARPQQPELPATQPPTQAPTDPPTDPPINLTVSQPVTERVVSKTDKILFAGTSDPAQSLKINGTEVSRNADGSFSVEVPLVVGQNEIVVSHKGENRTYTVEYRYAVDAFFPSEEAASFGSGATMQVSIFVRNINKVKVSATIGGQKITMKKAVDQLGSGVPAGFTVYSGTYKLPSNNTSDVDVGKITYTVSYDGVTETYTSGSITCKKPPQVLASDPTVTPNYGDYMDVGSGFIVEILTGSAETFVGTNANDYSDPRNNYLPKGTVDYASSQVMTSPSGSISYRLMRCGYKVYVQKRNYPPATNKVAVVDVYKGTLPDHNEIGVSALEVRGNHTMLVLDTMWKAPFYFDMLPQKYLSPSQRDYNITNLTAEYLEITFCYATKFEGEVKIPADNPLFSRAELTQNASDCTLRLYLKKVGGFYGWDAYYNENDQLCFRFVNPVKATASSANKYGADLTGLRIMLDVGHGGEDGGAVVKDASGKPYTEATLNLQLALKLKKELESMGATVIMNRSTDQNVSVQERVDYLKEQGPDLCIAIHQNSGEKASYNGCWIRYYTPFSKKVADAIYAETVKVDVYQKVSSEWDQSKYYVGRETACPVVLMENGFMTNAADFATMISETAQQLKAEAMAKGIAKYFLSIQ